MDTTKDEFILINKLVERAEELGLMPEGYDRSYIFMSMEAANEAFNLDLERMLEADDFNFAHDFEGINNNIKPHQGNDIGKSYTANDFGFFVPRFAQTENVVSNNSYKTPKINSLENVKSVGGGSVCKPVSKQI